MTYEADPRVDAYIGALPEWQQQRAARSHLCMLLSAQRRLASHLSQMEHAAAEIRLRLG